MENQIKIDRLRMFPTHQKVPNQSSYDQLVLNLLMLQPEAQKNYYFPLHLQ
jgi:hypothetical protein